MLHLIPETVRELLKVVYWRAFWGIFGRKRLLLKDFRFLARNDGFLMPLHLLKQMRISAADL
jgi:hypothetical protein